MNIEFWEASKKDTDPAKKTAAKVFALTLTLVEAEPFIYLMNELEKIYDGNTLGCTTVKLGDFDTSHPLYNEEKPWIFGMSIRNHRWENSLFMMNLGAKITCLLTEYFVNHGETHS